MSERTPSVLLCVLAAAMCCSHVGYFAIVVVCRAVVFQHVVDDVSASPARKYHLTVLVAHILRQRKRMTKADRKWLRGK